MRPTQRRVHGNQLDMHRWLEPPDFHWKHEGRRVRFRRFELAPRALRRSAQRSRDVEPPLNFFLQAADAGGSAAREGGRDACGGHGASIVVVRHLKVPMLAGSRQKVSRRALSEKRAAK